MSGLIGAYIEITGTCDEKCPYCYNEKLVGSGESLSFDTLSVLLCELKEQGITSVALSGGEPFLYGKIYEIMKYAEEIGMGLGVISNGKCFEAENIEILTRFQPGLQITFDGYDEARHDATRGKGNFAKITEGIIKARKSGYVGNIGLRVNLHRQNIGNIPEFLTMFEERFDVDSEKNRDVESIAIALLHKTESGGRVFSDYLNGDEYMEYPWIFDLFSKWNEKHTTQIIYDFNNPDIGCAYNASVEDVKCGLRIALDGNVFPCQMFTDDKFIIGNVYSQTLSESLNGELLSAFIDAVHGRKGNIEQCRLCGYKAMCAGGCPAQAYIENGTLNSISARCKSRKGHINGILTNLLQEAQNEKNQNVSER
jgi:uncharacterized protein